MKRFSGFAILWLVFASSTSQAASRGLQDFKLGGGVLWNDRLSAPAGAGGIHASADINLTRRFDLTPFYEYARRDSINRNLAGGELHYRLAVGDNRGAFYFGPGAGIARWQDRTKLHINGVGGFKYRLKNRIGIFAQGKYVWAAERMLNGAAVHGGMTLMLKKESRKPRWIPR